MEPIELIKKFQSISPDAGYSLRSKRRILEGSPLPRPQGWGWIIHTFDVGASLALAGVFLFVIFTGISLWKPISPLSVSTLDPSELKAEAQAVDIQVRLSNLTYHEPLRAVLSAPQAAVSTTTKALLPLLLNAATTTAPAASAATSTSGAASSANYGIDDALNALSR